MQALLLSLVLTTIFRASPWELKYRASLEKGPAEAVRFLGKSLHNRNPELERAIVFAAELGPTARSLWPQLVGILQTGAPLDQGAAAKALGWIGAREAIPALAKALSDRNWHVALSAADSLGGFGRDARETLEQLRQAEQTHWMGYVRQRAARARAAVERGAAPTPGPDADHLRKHFWEDLAERFWEDLHFPWTIDTACEIPDRLAALRIGGQWFDFVDHVAQAKASVDMLPPGIASRPELAGTTSALVVAQGWLVGTNRGGRGGDLRLVARRGRSIVLWPDGIRRLITVGSKTLAIASDTPYSAEVVEVLPDERARGGWTVRRLAQLPDEDLAAVPSSDDRLVVVTKRAGSVSVGLDGSIREERCPDEYLTKEPGAQESEEGRSGPGTPLPATVSGIREDTVRDHLDDTVAVLNLVLNHPRVVPFFHLEQPDPVRPRVTQLPAILPSKAFKVAGRQVEWVKALSPSQQGLNFRFLDLEFASTAMASVAFEHPGEGMEGYAAVARQDGVWKIVGIHVVER